MLSNADRRESSWTGKRAALLAVLSMATGLGACVVIAEFVLRLLPVAHPPVVLAVNAHNPLLRYGPNQQFTWSRGWNFALVNRGRTNNYGFTNEQDYDSSDHGPLLAVVGDSYVEAFMVPYQETLQGRLAGVVGDRGRVYSFGISGGALTQYLGEAEFAKAHFHPTGLVVVIVGNDFDECLRRYKAQASYYYFADGPTGLTLTHMDYAPSLWRRALGWFAVTRYLWLNLGLGPTIAHLTAGTEPSVTLTHFVGNTVATADSQRVADSERAVDEFLEELPVRSGLDRSRILLVVDGMRPHLYSAAGLRAAAGSYFAVMRRYLMTKARRARFEVIDMQPRFIDRYRRDSLPFDVPADGHWNAAGHAVAAAAVASSAVFARTFPSVGQQLAAWPR
jgi:hypothetical protein